MSFFSSKQAQVAAVVAQHKINIYIYYDSEQEHGVDLA